MCNHLSDDHFKKGPIRDALFWSVLFPCDYCPKGLGQCPYRLSNQPNSKRGFTQLGTLLNAKFKTKIELSIWDNLYTPSVIPWAIIGCSNPSLCAKQTTHWKTLLYGRQKKQKNLSDHKLDHHWWLGHPANSLFVGCSNRVCWWWDKVMDLDVAHHQGTPGHNRAHQGIQGTPGQGSHYFDCPSSRVRRGQLPCWAVNSEGPPWLDCPSN